jgi:hypothetical protein
MGIVTVSLNEVNRQDDTMKDLAPILSQVYFVRAVHVCPSNLTFPSPFFIMDFTEHLIQGKIKQANWKIE